MKTVTVIISTYNGAKHIERQLDSIFAQINVEINVLIRDDCSSDNTIQKIEQYINNHPGRQIRLIIGDNVGFAKSFWLGLRMCDDSDYYAFSDQDDVWKPEKLISCIEVMRDASEIPQLTYCKMQRSDEKLNRLEEQVNILKPEQLTKKLVLTQTYSYGAATVINKSAKNLVCRIWPDVEDLPHDMWVGVLCYWFGKVYYVDEELYYWIRYSTSVTGEGTKRTGIKYRLQQSLKKKSYPNVSEELLMHYNDLLEQEDVDFLNKIKNYKKNFGDKISLLIDKNFRRTTFWGTASLKLGIFLNWY